MLLSDFNSRQMRPDVRLHVRQLIGQDVADHLHRHPIARHLLPHSQSPAGGRQSAQIDAETFFFFGSAVQLRRFVSLLEQFDVAHDELLPVDEDHGHLLLRQQLAVQQRLVEDLNTQAQDSVTQQHTHDHIFHLFVINVRNYLLSDILLCL